VTHIEHTQRGVAVDAAAGLGRTWPTRRAVCLWFDLSRPSVFETSDQGNSEHSQEGMTLMKLMHVRVASALLGLGLLGATLAVAAATIAAARTSGATLGTCRAPVTSYFDNVSGGSWLHFNSTSPAAYIGSSMEPLGYREGTRQLTCQWPAGVAR
jgi:hypothetical protein